MFNLESSIAGWHHQMLAAGINDSPTLDELEDYLREEIKQSLHAGLNEPAAFDTAVRQIGHSKIINMEFKKIVAGPWNRPLARASWTLFAVSFFLPAWADGWGWQCAWVSLTAVTWSNFWHGNWTSIHLALLTPANLMMIASPFLQTRLSKNSRALNGLRFASFTAMALAWSFLFLLLVNGDGKDLRFGAYVWATSFVLLCLSTLKGRRLPRQSLSQ